jgi:predicted ATPase/class 3 adenylate cyclase/DNA-binding XRE family transcriptional regulator/Flp pilus assembly protein TadD
LAELSSFGEWLRRRRKALDLTQEQLAQRISCSTSALRKIEAEERRPSEQIVEQLAEVFHIAPTERASFLKFARGNWKAAPAGVMEEEAPWRISSEGEEVSQPKVHLATFLFTDIVGSSKHWETASAQMKLALQRHHEILKDAIISNGGNTFQIVGDAFCAVFATAAHAISAAVTAQRALHQESWELPFPIRVRMGIHTGEAEQTPKDSLTGGYASNPALNRVARILNAAHGGQILLSRVTKELVKDSLPANTELRDMGEHHFKYLTHPEHLFQLNIAGVPSDFPPLNTLDAVRHNLPVQLTSFIGRESEMAEVKYLLSTTRLLTLTGAGGSGKTRLAIQVATDLVDAFKDGVWWVELAALSDEALVPQAIAKVLGVSEIPNQSWSETIVYFLRSKALLFVLDNCEHLITTCAQLADQLLSACSNLKILATSREALGLTGESAWYVSTLSVPKSQDEARPDSLMEYEAIRLFIERAVAIKSGFALTEHNALSVARICRRLDGIPLAIELAAARVKVLSVEQIASRLDDRFNLLTSGSRTSLPRQQTLRATIEWSYELLTDKERMLFRRLAVFAGGWRLEAAEAVCSGESIEANEVLDLLTQLVNKSLVIMQEQEGEARYQMLETIRQYTREKLMMADEGELIRARHLAFFTQLAVTAEPALEEPNQVAWLNRLEIEHDNLRAALSWALERADSDNVFRLGVALGHFWFVHSHWSEGWRWLQQALDMSRRSENQTLEYRALRRKGLRRAAAILLRLGDYGMVQVLAEESLALSRELDDKRGMASSLEILGIVAHNQGDYAAARTFHQEDLELKRETGSNYITIPLTNLGSVAYAQGDYETARNLLQESLALSRKRGHKWGMASSLKRLGLVARAQGDFATAWASYQEALELRRELGDKWGMGNSLIGLGLVAHAQGDYVTARAFYQESLTLYGESGLKRGMAISLANLGHLALMEGNYVAARVKYVESLILVRESGSKLTIANCLVGCANLAQATGQAKRATKLCGAVSALLKAIAARLVSPEREMYEHTVNALRAQLDKGTFSKAWAKGQAMTAQQAIEYALTTEDE